MSLLCERPDSEFYQSLPEMRNARHNFSDNEVRSKLENFGRIFVKHGVEKVFGLAMVHRHFDISKDEVLVETLNDQKSVSVTSPWIIKDTTVAAPDNETLWIEHDTKMRQYVVPQTWSFDKNGELKPYEYLASDAPMEAPAQSFVAELYSKLKMFGLERNLGVRSIQNFLGRSAWETTPDNARSNVLVFGIKPDCAFDETSVRVLWYFDKNGKLYNGAWCGSCNNCKNSNRNSSLSW